MENIRILYQKQFDVLVGFVQGEIGGAELVQALQTQQMQTLLTTYKDQKHTYFHLIVVQLYGPELAEVYDHEIAEKVPANLSLRALVNIEDYIDRFLTLAQIAYQPVQRYSSLYSLVLSALPSYIDPPLDFITTHMMLWEQLNGPLPKAEKKKQLNTKAKELFQYQDKPPRWIQGAQWPIRQNKPLVFIGQLKLSAPALFHDHGAVYVFFDPASGIFEQIEQFH